MLQSSGFRFKRPVLLSLAVLGFALISIDASAQSENEKVEDISTKNSDRVILEDHTLLHDNSTQRIVPSKPSSPVKVTTPIKKDLNSGEGASEKEIKRSESPSTLSFNIFLYIVDKFKAD